MKQLKHCRICKSKALYKFLNLGEMPIPNGFLPKENLKKDEHKYELACFYCENCGLVQLTNVVDPNIMFKNYVYIPSTAKVMMNNFSHLTFSIHQKIKLGPKHLVVDIGSNDGSLLTFFKNFEAKVLGIDPAANLAKVAKLKGIPTLVGLFNKSLSLKALKKYGPASAITATNVIAHINNLDSLLEGVASLLSPRGVFVTEFPYLLDLIEKNQFDTIYHEHLSYFSLKPWKLIIEKHGFEIIDVERRQIHGGSIRITHRLAHKKKTHSKTVDYLIALEERSGLYDKKSFDDFAQRVMDLRQKTKLLLKDLRKQGKKIVGYGAAAKGNVLTNFYDLGTDTLKFIVDSTPYKQGLYTPGKHIPVYSEQKMIEEGADYALILAWNFADEIMEKQKRFKKGGGRFIIPIPDIKVI